MSMGVVATPLLTRQGVNALSSRALAECPIWFSTSATNAAFVDDDFPGRLSSAARSGSTERKIRNRGKIRIHDPSHISDTTAKYLKGAKNTVQTLI